MGCYQSKQKLKLYEKPQTFETTTTSKRSYKPQKHFKLKTIEQKKAPSIQEDTSKALFLMNIQSESIL
ncbi:hypothetical protein pb186bvf_014537 [Paramecium bursaria]